MVPYSDAGLRVLDLKPGSDAGTPSLDVVGWCLRLGVGAFFLLAGFEKFPSHPGNPWISLFDQIGIRQWFRYVTGAAEVASGLLFAVPGTTWLGAVLLGCAMLGAVAVHVIVLGHPGNAVIPVAALAAVLIVGFRVA